jgi:hypothetical protein
MAPHFAALVSELNKRGRVWNPEMSGALWTEIRPGLDAWAWNEWDCDGNGDVYRGTWRVRLFKHNGEFNDERYNDDQSDTGTAELTVENAAELARKIDEALDGLSERAWLMV